MSDSILYLDNKERIHVFELARFETSQRLIYVGSSKNCEISIVNSSISPRQFVLRYMGDDWHLFDFESKNGTFINSSKKRVESAILQDRDVIHCGNMWFQYFRSSTYDEVLARVKALEADLDAAHLSLARLGLLQLLAKRQVVLLETQLRDELAEQDRLHDEDLAELQRQIDRHEKDQGVKQRNLIALRQQLSSTEQLRDQLQSAVQEKDSENVRLRSELLDQSEDHRKQTDLLQDRLDIATQKLRRIEQEIQDEQSNKEYLERRLGFFESEAKKYRTSSDTHFNTLKEAQAKLLADLTVHSELRDDVAEGARRLQEAERSIGQLKAELEATKPLKGELQRKNDELTVLKRRMDQKEKEVADASIQKLTDKDTEIGQLVSKVNFLEGQARELNRVSAEQQKLLNKGVEGNRSLAAELQAAQGEQRKLEDQLSKRDIQEGELKRQVQQLRQDRERLRQEQQQMELTNKRLTQLSAGRPGERGQPLEGGIGRATDGQADLLESLWRDLRAAKGRALQVGSQVMSIAGELPSGAKADAIERELEDLLQSIESAYRTLRALLPPESGNPRPGKG